MLVLALDTSTPLITVTLATVQPGPVLTALAHSELDNAFAHAEQLMPLTRRVLATAGCSLPELAAVVVGVGPGPFTGLRVGIATAAALGEALSLPVYPIPSHDGFARAAQHVAVQSEASGTEASGTEASGTEASGTEASEPIATDFIVSELLAVELITPAVADLDSYLVVTDARRKEVFVTGFSGTVAVLGPLAIGPANLAPMLSESGFDPQYLVGPGTALLTDHLHLPIRELVEDLGLGLIRAAAEEILESRTPAPLTPLYLRRPDAVEPSKTRKSVLGR